MKTPIFSSIERLESRIAPSSLIIGVPPQSASYLDGDGDFVSVHVSSGALSVDLFVFHSEGASDGLLKLDLSRGGFDHADITFAVTKQSAGDGQVSIGDIDSTRHDLGRVTIAGNLDQLKVGDETTSDGAMTSLTAASLGRHAASGSAFVFMGRLGSLTVTGDVREVAISVQPNSADGTLGAVDVGGSLIGGVATSSGSIVAQGAIGAVKIGKDVRGGAGANSGQLKSGGDLAQAAVGGSVIGGSGNKSGEIVAGGNLPSLAIAGSLIGGSVTGDANLNESGYVEARNIGTMSVGGSVVSGVDTSTGTLTKSGSIRALETIDSLDVSGSLIGNSSSGGDTPVVIAAAGTPGTAMAPAIGKLSIGGSVSHALILAGSGVTANGLTGAQIGTLTVGGDWIASSAVSFSKILSTDILNDSGLIAATAGDYGGRIDHNIGVSAITANIANLASIQVQGTTLGTRLGNDPLGLAAEEAAPLTTSEISAAIIAGANHNAVGLSTGGTIRDAYAAATA